MKTFSLILTIFAYVVTQNF